MPVPPCAFIHVPKAAGNYFRHLLWSNVPTEVPPTRQCIIREEMDQRCFDSMPDEEVDRYHIITGHIGFRRVARLEGRLRVTLLRDPAERILSLYRYWRSAPYDAPVFQLARIFDIHDLLLGRGLQESEARWVNYYVDNAVTWQLADIFEERESSPLWGGTPDAVLAAAQSNLSTCWVGIVEKAEASIDLLIAEHSLLRPTGAWTRNDSPPIELDIDAEEVRELLGPRLALDDALYADAVERFTRRCTAQGL